LTSKIETSKAAIVRVKELQEQCEHGEISKEEKLARFVFDTFDNGSKEEIDEMEREHFRYVESGAAQEVGEQDRDEQGGIEARREV
jgi:hypothetical protein